MRAATPGGHEPPTSVDYIIRHAAPTLAGLKTGNLFPLAFQDKADFLKTLQEANRVLVPRGLRLLPLRLEENKALLYLFRTSSLSRDLAVRSFLQHIGSCRLFTAVAIQAGNFHISTLIRQIGILLCRQQYRIASGRQLIRFLLQQTSGIV